jgi:hypothetical protein
LPKLPGVNHLDAVRALEKAGFQIVRQAELLVMRVFRSSNSVRCSNQMAL